VAVTSVVDEPNLGVEALQRRVRKAQLDRGEDAGPDIPRIVFDSFMKEGIRERHARASHRSRNRCAAPKDRRR
jgi:hypothetical protein